MSAPEFGFEGGTRVEVLRDRVQEMLAEPGQTILLQSARSADAILRDGPGRTISGEAVEYLSKAVSTWLMSRLARAVDDGELPQKVEVEVTVRLGDERFVVGKPLSVPVEGMIQ